MMQTDVSEHAALAALRSPWLRPLNDLTAIDDLLQQVNPSWSLGMIRAQVLQVIRETSATRTFVLRTSRNWPGFTAGQYVSVGVEIDGIRHHRCYSLSSAPGGRVITITVKRHSGGKVSNWLHDRLRAGDVVTLDRPAGEFVLPRPLPERLLLLCAGSGITPLMSMVRDAHASGYRGDIALVQVCRRREDAIFTGELGRLEKSWPSLGAHLHCSAEAGRFDIDALTRLVPDYADRHTMLCGPQPFMTMICEHWHARGIDRQLQLENFAVPRASPATFAGTPVEVRLALSQRTFTAHGAGPLLVEAERAGLSPRHGCRMGICHTCQCVKRSGTVENLSTGQVSSEPDERIRLCITRGRSALVLDL